jgi:hypothetical protein
MLKPSLAKSAAAILLTSLVATAPISANAKDTTSTQSTDPAVISEWNEIAQKTLLADTTKAVPADFLYMGFVHAAVYNAVVGIQGRYEPYHFPTPGPKEASPQAAAIAAAYKILVAYSPQPNTPTWRPRTPIHWRRSPTVKPKPKASPSANWPPTP